MANPLPPLQTIVVVQVPSLSTTVGDPLEVAYAKINSNFALLQALIAPLLPSQYAFLDQNGNPIQSSASGQPYTTQ
jgi:hypothetical protein